MKDKHNSDVASYLSPESSPEDAAIQRAIAISIAEFTVGGVDGGDLASDDDGEEGGSGSGSDSEGEEERITTSSTPATWEQGASGVKTTFD